MSDAQTLHVLTVTKYVECTYVVGVFTSLERAQQAAREHFAADEPDTRWAASGEWEDWSDARAVPTWHFDAIEGVGYYYTVELLAVDAVSAEALGAPRPAPVWRTE